MLSIPTIELSEEVSDGHDDDDGIPTHWTWRFPASVDSLQPVDYRRMVLTYAHLFFIRSLIFCISLFPASWNQIVIVIIDKRQRQRLSVSVFCSSNIRFRIY